MTQREKKPYQRVLKQPLNIIEIPDALLQMQTVVVLCGLSPASVNRKVKAKEFPQPIKDGTHCTRWRAGDVKAWLKSKAPEAVAA